MKVTAYILLWTSWIFFGCQTKRIGSDKIGPSAIQVNALKILKKEVELHPGEGLVYYKDQPFTGTTILNYANGKVAEHIEYRNGRQEGYYRKWFDTGLLSYEATYRQGYLNGEATSWWKNGNIRSHSQYEEGMMDGVQTQWYKSGAKFKERNITMNREVGLQRSWRENGKLYNNYEARNGRIFGLKRANLCYSVNDEEIQFKK